MGEVWRAEQTSPVRRTVALKLIKAGMDSRAVVARFEAERQALALMDHAGIAKVFDAGITPQGRPYFAMEYVPGVPLTEYCDTRRLGTRERLELFQRVCEGVQHAHQKAVLHRDLKPSNILVADVDGKPLPRIIDFGVAKATTQKLTEKTMFTALGQLVGTPEYMSPEQADLTVEDVDTRTDVYSLGVILYELLAGALPFDPTQLRKAGFEGIIKLLREKDPPRPSTKVSSLGERTTEVAQSRRTEPRRLVSQLRGDLDWIVMRSLEKDRNRRYGSPQELAQDIERHLNDEPVLAGPPSAAYRTRKFARRHRLGVGIASTALLVLIALAVVMSILRGEAERARAEAQARAEELKIVTEFQASMLSEIDPVVMGRALRDNLRERMRVSLEGADAKGTNREAVLASVDDILRRANATDVAIELVDQQLLSRAAEAIERDFADQPLVRATLRQTLADTYREISLFPQALPLQEAALETRETALGEHHEQTLYSLTKMSHLLINMNDREEALRYCRKAFEGNRRALGEEHPQTLESACYLGFSHMYMGDLEEALRYSRKAMDGNRRVLGEEHRQTLQSIQVVGFALTNKGRPDLALPYLREALEGSRRVLGDDHPETLDAIENVGWALERMNRFDEALVYHREALERRRRVLGDDHPSTLQSVSITGRALRGMGRFEEALAYYREALERGRRVLGDDHRGTLGSLSGMGWVLYEMGRLDEALACHREALEGRRRVFGDDHRVTLRSVTAMGVLLVDRGSFEEGRALLESHEPSARQAFVLDTRRLGVFLSALGRSRAATGAFEAGLANLLEAEAKLTTAQDRERVLSSLVASYEAWNTAEPGQGHGARAAEWRAKLAELQAGNGSAKQP
jgi:non-specific serine/threonine protein kinase/serine/threonine-protein kinase